MPDLKQLAGVPEVKSAVLSDPSGAWLDALRHPEPEAAAAVTGVVTGALAGVGDGLGLGAVQAVVTQGPSSACVVVLRGQTITTAFVAPTAIAAVEKLLDPSLRGA